MRLSEYSPEANGFITIRSLMERSGLSWLACYNRLQKMGIKPEYKIQNTYFYPISILEDWNTYDFEHGKAGSNSWFTDVFIGKRLFTSVEHVRKTAIENGVHHHVIPARGVQLEAWIFTETEAKQIARAMGFENPDFGFSEI